MFDAKTPAPGVLVLPVPMPRMSGLSHSQAKGRRTKDFTFSVLAPKPRVQPIKTSGGGLPPSMVKPSGDTRSKNHRRRSPKMRAHNPCFQKHIPSNYQYDQQRIARKLAQLEGMYRRIAGGRVDAQLDKNYERARESFGRLHRELFGLVAAMERRVEGVCHA